jgi:prepilin-type N-terminal cleavage/methylation domain-containing protein
MRTNAPRASQSGFSLIELLTAMGITLIVSGAIYGLMVSSQNAFIREPALSDRQQNVRMGMEMITQDVLAAGAGMDAFVQAFTPALNGTGQLGSTGPGGVVPNPVWGSPNSDVLEIMSNTGTCPAQTVGNNFSKSPTVPDIDLLAAPPACFPLAPQSFFVYVGGPGGPGTLAPKPPGLLYATCTPGPKCNGGLGIQFPANNYNPAPAGLCPAGGSNAGDCVTMQPIQLAAYEIFPDPTDGVMSLWRNDHGRLDPGCPACAPGTVNPANRWTLVARGIDDLRVRFQDGTVVGPTLATPQTIAQGVYTTIVQQVQVTLVGATTMTGPQPIAGAPGRTPLQGATVPAGGPQVLAIRGQLVLNIAPRAGLVAASHGAPALWN